MPRLAALALAALGMLAAATATPAARAPFLTGVVEGYYGRPWTGSGRRDVIRFLGAHGMNTFVYGPKNDLFHRDQWRDLYPDRDLGELARAAKEAHKAGVQFVYALSPALDICYSCPADTRALRRKLRQVGRARIKRFALFFDDAPTTLSSPEDVARYGGSDSAALARAQADLVRRTNSWLARRGRKRLLFMVPTDYSGTACSPYLDALDAALPEDVPVGWTGTAVIPATITAEEAAQRRACLGNRPLVLWDNYPVNDAILSSNLHLGPLVGRAANLGTALGGGHLLNPMTQARASLVALGTAGAYFANPGAYDPEAAWRATLAELAPPGTVEVLAEQTRSSALDLTDAHTLAAIVDQLEATYAGPDWTQAVHALDEEGIRQHDAGMAIVDGLDGLPLASEVLPWALELKLHATEAIQAADLFEAMKPAFTSVAFANAGGQLRLRGRILHPDEDEAIQFGDILSPPRLVPTFGALQACLGPLLTPDIVFCPQLGLNVHGKQLYLVLGAPIVLVTGRNEHEPLIAFAVATYQEWTSRQTDTNALALTADGVAVPLTKTNDFDIVVAPGKTVRLVATSDAGDATALECPNEQCPLPD